MIDSTGLSGTPQFTELSRALSSALGAHVRNRTVPVGVANRRQPQLLVRLLVTPGRIELAISGVRDRRHKPLDYGAS